MVYGLGEAMLLTWAQLGVLIDNVEETPESLNVYISVPRSSYHRNSENEEMSGVFLARRFKNSFLSMSVKPVVVRAKIREELWTQELSKDAVFKTRKELYGNL